MPAILADAKQRVMGSALYRKSSVYRVFLCGSPQVFAFFADVQYRVGGINMEKKGFSEADLFKRPVDRDKLEQEILAQERRTSN
jgi:hypothetical protein